MQAGQLSERVVVKRQVEAERTDGWNADVTNYESTDYWARVVPVKGNERLRASQVVAEADYLIYTRLIPDITTESVLVWRKRTLNVISVLETEKRDGLIIQASETINDGS